VVLSQEYTLKQIIKISDSLELNEKYIDAIDFWKKNTSVFPILSKNYISYFEYWNDFENQSFDTIISIEKSLLKIKNRNSFESEFLVKIFSQHYHHIAENDTWEKALEKGLEGYQIKDFHKATNATKTDYLYDLGFMYSETGNYFETIKFYKKSLALYINQVGENSTDVALNYNNLAYAYTKIYNQKNTIAYYVKAAKIWEKIYKNSADKNDYLLTVYNNLIYQYINYGDLAKAKINLEKLNFHFNKKYQSEKSKNESAYFESLGYYFLNNIRVNAASNKIDIAIEFLHNFEKEQTLIYKNLKKSKYLLQCYAEIIHLLNENNEFEKALDLGNKALVLCNKLDNPSFLITFNATIAKSYKCLNKYDLALQFYENAKKATTKNYFNSSSYTLEYLKAEIFDENNKQKKAVEITKNNIEQLVDEHLKKKKSIEKINFTDVKELISIDFITLFYKSGKIYFNSYKKSKSKNELKIAYNLYLISNKLFKEYYLKGEYNDELNKCHTEITEGLLEIALEKKISKSDKMYLINAIEQNESQHLAKEFFKKVNIPNNGSNKNIEKINYLKNELNYYKNQKFSNNILAEKNSKKITTIQSEIKKLLDKTSQTYQEIEKTSLDNFDIQKVQKLISKEEIVVKYYVLLNDVYALFITFDEIEIKKIAKTTILKNAISTLLSETKIIHQNVLNSSKIVSNYLLPNLNAKKLTIIPDEFLNYLPFELLFDKVSNQYLVEKSTLSYDYSLALYLFNKQNNIKIDNKNLIAFSPNYKNQETASVRSGFSELKFAKQEAILVSKLFDGTIFLNENATKSQFFKSINNFGLFHLAMHSNLFDDNLNESSLVFSNNVKLYFSELYGLNFPAKMAVLSACDTGNGNLKSGEGIMSLSRAFTYAGVQSSVYSLWQVPDKETSEIMISFYENLKKGQSKDEALANAKKIFIAKNPMKNHPFYWAGFIVNGDVSPIIKPYNWIVIASLVLLISLSFLVVFRKKLFYFRK